MGGCGSVDKKMVTNMIENRKGLNYMDEVLVTNSVHDEEEGKGTLIHQV